MTVASEGARFFIAAAAQPRPQVAQIPNVSGNCNVVGNTNSTINNCSEITWRLPGDQKERLESVLGKVPESDRFKVRVLALMSSRQSQTFSSDLYSALHDQHWDVEKVTDLTMRPDLSGLSIQVPNGTKTVDDIPSATRKLIEIFTAAKIPFILRPPGTATYWDTPAIAVGSKPNG